MGCSDTGRWEAGDEGGLQEPWKLSRGEGDQSHTKADLFKSQSVTEKGAHVKVNQQPAPFSKEALLRKSKSCVLSESANLLSDSSSLSCPKALTDCPRPAAALWGVL